MNSGIGLGRGGRELGPPTGAGTDGTPGSVSPPPAPRPPRRFGGGPSPPSPAYHRPLNGGYSGSDGAREPHGPSRRTRSCYFPTLFVAGIFQPHAVVGPAPLVCAGLFPPIGSIKQIPSGGGGRDRTTGPTLLGRTLRTQRPITAHPQSGLALYALVVRGLRLPPQGLVRFCAEHRIKSHVPRFVRVPVNPFKFQPCGRSP